MDTNYMKILFIWSIFNTISVVSRTGELEECESPQYVELGKTGIIHCTFQKEFYGVFWYNSTSYRNEDPILSLKGANIAGPGYNSGEFDVFSNGSLVIYKVAMHHNHYFTVVYLKTKTDPHNPRFINVVVFAKPLHLHPLVNGCGQESGMCFTTKQRYSKLYCFFNETIPAMTLTWMERTLFHDKNVSFEFSVLSDGLFHSSFANTSVRFGKSRYFECLVCTAVNPLPLFEKLESIVLVENMDRNFSSIKAVHKHVENGTSLELECTNDDFLFLLWKKKQTTELFNNIGLTLIVDGTKKMLQLQRGGLTVNKDGTLNAKQMTLADDGIYICGYGDGISEEYKAFEVIVYVLPNSAYPTVDGCVHNVYCVLELHREGILTCRVNEIRPVVELSWYVSESSSRITFLDHRVTVNGDGDTFNVSLSSKYIMQPNLQVPVTIECRLFEPKFATFERTVKVDLYILHNATNREHDNGTDVWKSAVTVVCVVVVFILVAATVFMWTVRRRMNRNERRSLKANTTAVNIEKEKSDEQQEKVELMPQTSPSDETSEYAAKKNIFIEQLSERYKDMYAAISPIPYMKDCRFSIENVFVESRIKLVNPSQKTSKKNTIYYSYNDIVNEKLLPYSRIVIEGDPGYGKSTLTLQFAYDWCNKVKSSPLRNANILIILRLRQVGGVGSIFTAIKRFILPRDPRIDESDIECIMYNCPSVVIILDGFDEYPDKEEKTQIMEIIRREMFQNAKVIITTRSFCVPKGIPAKTIRLQLTGFDDAVQDKYILKAVVDDVEKAKEIKQRLEDNPTLSGICRVPLFFVMFAHITKEREKFQKFDSVTDFFRYVISCFHSHRRNKLTEDEVKKCLEFELDHRDLDQESFLLLTDNSNLISWEKAYLCDKVGKDFYKEYVQIGILVEEEVHDMSCVPHKQPQSKTEVRFFHKLFCEWYAAHFLSACAVLKRSKKIKDMIAHLDPMDLQYVYRFGCGLNPEAGEKILKYLERYTPNSERFSMLCLLEQRGNFEGIRKVISKMCSVPVSLRKGDDQLFQASTIQLLKLASNHEIPISCLGIYSCFSNVDTENTKLVLRSGQAIRLHTLHKLVISEPRRQLRDDEFGDILQFLTSFNSLETMWFYGCLLPAIYNTEEVLKTLSAQKVTVEWFSPLSQWFQLHLASGKWRRRHGKQLTEMEYKRLVEEFHDNQESSSSSAESLHEEAAEHKVNIEDD